LGVLARLHPKLKGDEWLAGKFREARCLSVPDASSFGLYLSLLGYRLSGEEAEQLISRLRLPKLAAQALRDTISLKNELASLTDPELSPSRIYSLVCGYATPAVMANALAGESAVACQHLNLFLSKLRYIKPALNGGDLMRMGIAPGPKIKETLKRLLEARLDGKVKTKRDEESLVKRLLAEAER
jgi:tRNA nucleotidyltransferase (CCA-adding enzyme)